MTKLPLVGPTLKIVYISLKGLSSTRTILLLLMSEVGRRNFKSYTLNKPISFNSADKTSTCSNMLETVIFAAYMLLVDVI